MFPCSGRFLDPLQRLAMAGLLVLVATAAVPTFAQEADPPGRAARLADAEGQVWVYTPESATWIAAQRNQVLTAGDRVATDRGARAELQIGSTTVRLDGGSELGVQRLDDEHLVLQLQDGTVISRLRDPAAAGQFEIDTDNGRILGAQAGVFQIAQDDGRSDLTVFSGEVRYEGPNSALPLGAGQRAQFWLDAGGVAQYSTLAPANDAFTAWSAERDRRESAVLTERYVSPEMTGVADLDAYGRWEQNDEVGPVWVPVVAVDWAPYSQGHWAWVGPWGWTWVDDAPWGFAPFHYGRWLHVRDTWCWMPGPRVTRPVYAPALVGWISGPRANGGGPTVGWLPLGPREVFVPSYRVSPRYAERLNVAYVGNASAIRSAFDNPQGPRDFMNRRFPRAITVVPTEAMIDHRPVGPAAAPYRQAPWVRDLATGPARVAALVAPPVATPPVAAGASDSRAVRPPPGGSIRPAFDNRPAVVVPSPRDRSPNDRDRGGRESHDTVRPAVPAWQPSPVSRPGMPPYPSEAGSPNYPSGTGTPPYPARVGAPLYPPTPGQLPSDPGQSPASRRQVPDPSRPASPSAVPRAIQEGPNMRALPVYREERGQPQVPPVVPAPPPQPVPAARPLVDTSRSVAPPQSRPAQPVVPTPSTDARRNDAREQMR